VDLLRGLHHGTATASSHAASIAQPIGGLIYPKGRIEELFRIFETDQVAVVVDAGHILGIISQIDLIEYMAKRGK
jgi:cystathionine beta-synthase